MHPSQRALPVRRKDLLRAHLRVPQKPARRHRLRHTRPAQALLRMAPLPLHQPLQPFRQPHVPKIRRFKFFVNPFAHPPSLCTFTPLPSSFYLPNLCIKPWRPAHVDWVIFNCEWTRKNANKRIPAGCPSTPKACHPNCPGICVYLCSFAVQNLRPLRAFCASLRPLNSALWGQKKGNPEWRLVKAFIVETWMIEINGLRRETSLTARQFGASSP